MSCDEGLATNARTSLNIRLTLDEKCTNVYTYIYIYIYIFAEKDLRKALRRRFGEALRKALLYMTISSG